MNSRTNEAEARGVEHEAQALGAKTLVVMGAAGELQTVEEMQRRAAVTFGRVDIYVSNAARRLHKTFFDTTYEDWHFFLNQQLTASWYQGLRAGDDRGGLGPHHPHQRPGRV